MPIDWDITFKDNEGYYKLDYSKSSVVLFGAVKELIKEVEDLKKEISKLKGEASPKAKAKAKAKSKS